MVDTGEILLQAGQQFALGAAAKNLGQEMPAGRKNLPGKFRCCLA